MSDVSIHEAACGCVAVPCGLRKMRMVRTCRVVKLLMGEIPAPEGWELLPGVSVNDELERHFEDIVLNPPI